jgi:hypothetical protein
LPTSRRFRREGRAAHELQASIVNGRVRYAADLIASGARLCRAFDSCFENYVGDAVAVVILRQAAITNPDLARNFGRDLNRPSAEADAERWKHFNDEQLKREAARLRREGRAVALSTHLRNVQLDLL